MSPLGHRLTPTCTVGMSWAVVCLNKATARLSSSTMSTYGCLPTINSVGGAHVRVNVTDSIQHIPQSPKNHPTVTATSTTPESTVNATASMHDDPTLIDAFDTTLDDSDDMEGIIDFDVDADEDDTDDDVDYEFNNEDQPYAEDCLVSNDITARKISPAHTTGSSASAQFELPQSNCNLLVTSTRDVLLLNYQFGVHTSVLCKGLVAQDTHGSSPLFSTIPQNSRFERLNLIHQIPELGVVLVGNQAGQVAIITMTYYADKKHFGFRTEAIVPFKSQDELKIPNHRVLLGIAVGPVQGCQPKAYSPSTSAEAIPPSRSIPSRRYRLLLYFHDHSILSYEISYDDEDGFLII